MGEYRLTEFTIKFRVRLSREITRLECNAFYSSTYGGKNNALNQSPPKGSIRAMLNGRVGLTLFSVVADCFPPSCSSGWMRAVRGGPERNLFADLGWYVAGSWTIGCGAWTL